MAERHVTKRGTFAQLRLPRATQGCRRQATAQLHRRPGPRDEDLRHAGYCADRDSVDHD